MQSVRDLLPSGVHQIEMVVRPSGLAINTNGDCFLLNVELRLDALDHQYQNTELIEA